MNPELHKHINDLHVRLKQHAIQKAVANAIGGNKGYVEGLVEGIDLALKEVVDVVKRMNEADKIKQN